MASICTHDLFIALCDKLRFNPYKYIFTRTINVIRLCLPSMNNNKQSLKLEYEQKIDTFYMNFNPGEVCRKKKLWQKEIKGRND